MPVTIPCQDITEAVEFLIQQLGFRLDMIAPADSPRLAQVSGHGLSFRLENVTEREPTEARPPNSEFIISRRDDNDWRAGRAGMEYRDLIPGRIGGQLIASHIRLTKGGEVPDYVHYHKIRFQMIYCISGRIRAVYQDQGPPFWLEPGDCIVQPPEIRHRVLEAETNSEVVEISNPAVHETWVDHDIVLPNPEDNPDHLFSGQRFLRHTAEGAQFIPTTDRGCEVRDTGASTATGGLVDVREVQCAEGWSYSAGSADLQFYFVLDGTVEVESSAHGVTRLGRNDALTVVNRQTHLFKADQDARVLEVSAKI